jgi:hypothetical protein
MPIILQIVPRYYSKNMLLFLLCLLFQNYAAIKGAALAMNPNTYALLSILSLNFNTLNNL